jgi:hypothetical protein
MPFYLPDEAKLQQVVTHFDQLVTLLKELLMPNQGAIAEQKAALNDLVYEIFGLTSVERALVEDTLKYSLGYFEWGKRKERTVKDSKSLPVQRPNPEMLQGYAEAFSEVVTTLLHYQGQTLNARVYHDGTPLSVVEFEVVSENEARPVEILNSSGELKARLKQLDKLLVEQQSETLYMRRHVRIYEQNRIYLVRPSEQRFWTRSQARADADSFVSELLALAKPQVMELSR